MPTVSRGQQYSYLAEVITSFAHKRVDEVRATESTSDKGVDVPAVGSADLAVAAYVREDVVVTHRDEGYG